MAFHGYQYDSKTDSFIQPLENFKDTFKRYGIDVTKFENRIKGFDLKNENQNQ